MLTTVKGKSFRATVYSNTSPKPSGEERRKKEYSRERLDEDISICLTCTKEKCTGMCKRIEDSRREISMARKAEVKSHKERRSKT